MKRKGVITAGLLCAVLVTALAAPVSAHGRGHRSHCDQAGSGSSAMVCPYEDCTESGRHVHDGVSYCGYAHESGHCGGHGRHGCH